MVRGVVLIALLAASLSEASLQGTVDAEDLRDAIRTIEAELPWSASFRGHHCCLVDNVPYTMRVALSRAPGHVRRHVDCVRPWRVVSWICQEVDDTCDAFTVQSVASVFGIRGMR